MAEELFRTNAGCRLPCWWGFTPGVIRWEDAKRFLTPFTHEIVETGSLDKFFATVRIQVPEEIYPGDFAGFMRNVYFVKEGVIEAIEIYLPLVPTYNLPVFLSDYGPPDEVYIETFPEEREGWVDFSVFLYYGDLGLLTHYGARGEDLGDYIQGCFGDDMPGLLMVWATDRNWSYREVVDKGVGFGIQERFNFALEEATDLDAEAFYNIFKDVKTPQCITVPKTIFAQE